MTFNYYPASITSSRPLGTVTLDRFLGSIQYPKKNISEVFAQIQDAQEKGDMNRKNDLKTKLFSFTPAVLVEGKRRYECIQEWTGLLPLDFDKLPSPEYTIDFKRDFFKEHKFIVACWLSPSRYGVRALAKIPVCHSVGEYKEYYGAIENELCVYRGFDSATKNCILPMFLSYDPDLLRRSDYTEWTEKYIPPSKPPPTKQFIVDDKTDRIQKIIASKINRIVDNGHPQLRATSYLLGGYVSAGYIQEHIALQMIEHLIDSNEYLSQKAHVYKRTASDMIQRGKRQPIHIQ